MKRLFSKVALVTLIWALVGCSAGTVSKSSIPVATHAPTPSIASGTVLYQSDWSQGLAAWGNPPGWKSTNGIIQSDLSDNNALTVPYISAVPNYAIEVLFQIVSVPTDGGYFVVTAKQLPKKDGYDAGILNLLSPAPHNEFANPQVQVYLKPMDDMSTQMVLSDYEPGSIWHTFRIEVQGANVRFLINGIRKSSATSIQNDFLSNGPFQVISAGAVVNVASIRVMAL
ncbi:MAG: hypothetical protein ACRDHZ_07375 [Ktedonobacteraceae bacterium]